MVYFMAWVALVALALLFNYGAHHDKNTKNTNNGTTN